MTHLYTLLYRPPGHATLPKGWTLVERPQMPGWERRGDLPVSAHQFGVVAYERPLTQEEIRAYELRPLVPVILSYGMGVESTAILLRWLEEPASRDFDLGELTVVTAMTGDEFDYTGQLVDEHILPRMRAAGIRFVQVARETYNQSVIVLDDSRSPARVHLKGKYKLSDEMLDAGTIPTSSGTRKCSIHAKGWPLDAWLQRELGDDAVFRHAIGFNSGELSRVEKDQSFGGDKFGGRAAMYPLVDWGWNREMCEEYIQGLTGVAWPKSACAYCPFAAGREPVMVRFDEEPELGAFSLLMEFVSLCFNHRMTLYATKSLLSVVQRRGMKETLEAFDRELVLRPWAVYSSRRYYFAAGVAWRSITKLGPDTTRGEAERAVMEMGGRRDGCGIVRLFQHDRREEWYPAIEGTVVAAPAVVSNKERPQFQARWEAFLAGGIPQIHQPPKRKKRIPLPCPMPKENPQAQQPSMGELLEEDDSREAQLRWEADLGDVLARP
jgi:hypothetical protein